MVIFLIDTLLNPDSVNALTSSTVDSNITSDGAPSPESVKLEGQLVPFVCRMIYLLLLHKSELQVPLHTPGRTVMTSPDEALDNAHSMLLQLLLLSPLEQPQSHLLFVELLFEHLTYQVSPTVI